MRVNQGTARIAILFLLACSSAGGAVAQSPCLTDSLGAQRQAQFVEAQFGDPDTTWRPKLGLPQRIHSLRLVRDDETCDKALLGLRAQGDGLRSDTSAGVYLFEVDPDLYVAAGGANLGALTFFDRRWRYIVTLVGLN